MRYTKEQIDKLKETSMADILRDLGYDTRHTASGLFFSPFRTEKSPSFHINDRDHKWADLGSADPTLIKPGKKAVGGDVIDLVCALRNCSFSKALDFLAAFHPTVSPAPDEIIGPSRSKSPGTIKIECVGGFSSSILLSYATQKRRIPEDLLRRYCSQVSYRIVHEDGTSTKDYFAIGFPNRSGHWTLRNSVVKLSSGSDITFVGRDGSFLPAKPRPTSKAVAVFEGFMDFLSWLAWRGREVPGDCDCIILNSTSNTAAALDFVLEHSVAIGYFDNDVSGRNHSNWLASECDINSDSTRKVTYHDCSDSFEGYNDINEAWVDSLEKAERERREHPAVKEEKDAGEEKDEEEHRAPAMSPRIH